LSLAAAQGPVASPWPQVGQRPSGNCDGLSYRLIGRNLWLSKNTVIKIVRRGAAV